MTRRSGASDDGELRRRAAELGVIVRYEDVDHVEHDADDEVLRPVVEILESDRDDARRSVVAGVHVVGVGDRAGLVEVSGPIGDVAIVVDGTRDHSRSRLGGRRSPARAPDRLPHPRRGVACERRGMHHRRAAGQDAGTRRRPGVEQPVRTHLCALGAQRHPAVVRSPRAGRRDARAPEHRHVGDAAALRHVPRRSVRPEPVLTDQPPALERGLPR